MQQHHWMQSRDSLMDEARETPESMTDPAATVANPATADSTAADTTAVAITAAATTAAAMTGALPPTIPEYC